MAMKGRARLEAQQGRYSLVDHIPFAMPVSSRKTPCLMAGFPINAEKAAKLLPGNEVHPLRLWNKGVLMIAVVDYRDTVIGKYIEFSIAIACTHGKNPAPRLLPGLMRNTFGTGQFVVDLPVSTEVSVRGGKGIWGMPKHRANLRFDISEKTASSQYDLDGKLCVKIEVEKSKPWLPLKTGAANYCAFRGMLMKSYIYFKGTVGMSLFKKGAATLTIGDHPRVRFLNELEIEPDPVFTVWLPETQGLLDDYFEAWFLTHDRPPDPSNPPEGMESTINLCQSQEWMNEPFAPVPSPTRRTP